MRNHLRDLLTRAIEKTVAGEGLNGAAVPPLQLELPKQREFGEWPLHGYALRNRAPMRGRPRANYREPSTASRLYLSGIGVARFTATAVTLFCGEPSITRSEYVR